MARTNNIMPLASPPVLTTIVTILAVFITISVFYLIISALKGRRFNTKLAVITIIINIVTLLLFEINRTKPVTSIPAVTFFGAVHGIFGVAAIAAFIILIKLAHNYNKAEMNYIQSHHRFPYFILFLWLTSFLTGETLYFLMYVV
ncbi:MAG TPA: hypothetical protein VJB11_03305 [archaeon]|nr:hypothetical protein [archaeon]